MSLTDEERARCHTCLRNLRQTKWMCIQSIQYLLEQQSEIDECIADLKTTKVHAQAINAKISELNDVSWWRLCLCVGKSKPIFEPNLHEQNQLLILPFPSDSTFGLNEFEKELNLEQFFRSFKNPQFEFTTKDQFEHILHDEYAMLLDLARQLTKCVQILHDTIEFLDIDVKSTLDHMQAAQPRLRRMLKAKAPFAFARLQTEPAI